MNGLHYYGAKSLPAYGMSDRSVARTDTNTAAGRKPSRGPVIAMGSSVAPFKAFSYGYPSSRTSSFGASNESTSQAQIDSSGKETPITQGLTSHLMADVPVRSEIPKVPGEPDKRDASHGPSSHVGGGQKSTCLVSEVNKPAQTIQPGQEPVLQSA